MFNSIFLKRRNLLTGLSVFTALVTTSVVQAETVFQAMSYAYANSPQIQLEREKLKLSDESIISAEAGLFPTLNGQLSITDNWSKSYSNAAGGWQPSQNILGVTASLNANYTLWDNGITGNRIAQAEIGRLVQEASFANAEQNFLATIFTGYVDVLRDSALLNAQIKNFNVLAEQQRASEARFNVGEATLTDVSLAKARKSAATSSIAGAKATLDGSRAAYEQNVGHQPKNIRQPKFMSGLLPKSLNAALASAAENHPAIQANKRAVLSAEKAVLIAEAGLLPSVAAFGSASHNLALDGKTSQTSLQIGARMTIPIFNGGVNYSKIRQEKIKLAQARLNLSVTRAQLRANVKSIWAGVSAAKTSVVAAEQQIVASRATLNGVRAEAAEGVSTSFDVLNSEQELLQANVQSIVSQRGVLVSQIQLLSAVGRLSAVKLGL